MRNQFLSESKSILKLALPVVFAQLGVVMLGFVDLVMLSRYSQQDMNAAGLGTLWMFGTNVFAMGLVFGMDPLVTLAVGEKNADKLKMGLQTGFVLALVGTMILLPLWTFTEVFLLWLGQDPELATKAQSFVRIQIPSIPFFLFYMAIRQYLIAQNRALPIVVFIILANFFNGLLNWIFIYGNLGFPELGLGGSALSTTLMRILQCFGLMVSIRRDSIFRQAILQWDSGLVAPMKVGLSVGSAVGLQYLFETWGLQVLTLMAGWLGSNALAAQNILMNVLSLCFISALGLSFAVTSRIGNVLGSAGPVQARRVLWISFGLSTIWLGASGFLLFIFQNELINFYHPTIEVSKLASTMILLLVWLQFFDGIQIVVSGALRAMSASHGATLIHFLGLYFCGLPLAYYLGIHLDLGLRGIWMGAVSTFSIVSVVVLVWTLRHPKLSQN